MEDAVADYLLFKDDPVHKQTLANITMEYNLPKSSIGHHLSGRCQYIADFNAEKSHVTVEESLQLIKWLDVLAHSGCGLGQNEVAELASKLLKDKYGDPDFSVNAQWADQWLAHYHHLVCKKWTTSLTTLHAQALNPGTIQHWFGLVEGVLNQFNIKPSLIFGADETGVQMDNQGHIQVIALADMKQVHHQSNSLWESLTLLVFTCADSTSYPPSAIFWGKNLLEEWVIDNPLEAL